MVNHNNNFLFSCARARAQCARIAKKKCRARGELSVYKVKKAVINIRLRLANYKKKYTQPQVRRMRGESIRDLWIKLRFLLRCVGHQRDLNIHLIAFELGLYVSQ